MASQEQIEKELAKHPRWRGQTIAHLKILVALWADLPASNLPEKVIQAAYGGKLLAENTDYRNAFKGLWENPVADHWEYTCSAAEDLLTQECVKRGLNITTENLETVWPTVKPILSRGPQYDVAQRQAAEADRKQRAQDARKGLREALLADFIESFEAARRRDGDIQSLRQIDKAREREEARLASLTTEQLFAEGQRLANKISQASEVKRLQNAPLSEVSRVVREQAQQPRQSPRQAYASTPGQQFPPLPPDYKGLPWTTRTLERASDASDLRRLLRTYGADALNEAVALNKNKGVV